MILQYIVVKIYSSIQTEHIKCYNNFIPKNNYVNSDGVYS